MYEIQIQYATLISFKHACERIKCEEMRLSPNKTCIFTPNRNNMKINTTFFSATNTTRTIVTELSKTISTDIKTYNITNNSLKEDIHIASDEVLLVGMPVYAGRIPSVAVESLKHFKGSHTPVILVSVYGNREFDDIFVEMQDIFEANGFFVIAAAAFIAQHSIFPRTAKGRPDTSDFQKINEFAQSCKKIIDKGFAPEAKSISLPGNRPYKIPGNIPLKVTTSSKCTECHACIRVCPVNAIPADNPHVTDYTKCIHCGRCIYVCAEHARHYGGLLYHVAGSVFGWKNRKRKEPQFFF